MLKRLLTLLLSLSAVLSLCGCGSVFDKEYVLVRDYVPAAASDDDAQQRVTVKNLSELKLAILSIVSSGESESNIYFDPAYDGDVTEDMAQACWQVRTKDALCAYCVENIAYELNRIVTYYEARVTVSYSDVWQGADSVVRLQYSAGAEDAVKNALCSGSSKLLLLIGTSSYSAETMENLVLQTYRANPASAPRQPSVSVNMFSGTGLQRLYEINLGYGLSQEELALRREQMAELDPFSGLDTENMSEAEKALAACMYLCENCEYFPGISSDSIYSALVTHTAGSEGLALAYVELCRQLGIQCCVVYGQRSWQEHCWNIIELDGAYYHADMSQCLSGSMESGFLRNDEQMWGSYRWDLSSYPACSGDLTYAELIAEVEKAEPVN